LTSEPQRAAEETRRLIHDTLSPADSLTQLAQSSGGSELHRRLIYLMLFRVVLISLVLGATTVLYWLSDVDLAQPNVLMVYAIVIATYVLTIVYAILLRRERPGKWIAHAQLIGDLAIATILVHITGGAQSAYTFFFPLTIIGSAVVLYRRGAVMVTVAAALLFSTVSLLGWLEVLPAPVGQRVLPHAATGLEFGRFLALNLAAIAGVGALAFNLGGQLQRTSASLEEQRTAAADLLTLHEDIVHCLTSGLITVDTNGKVMTMNQAAQDILGVPIPAAIGRPLGRTSTPLAELLQQTPESRPARRGEVAQPVGKGELILGVSISPLYNHHYDVVGRILNFQDLTEMRTMERHVKRAERLAVIGGLAAGVAHEIRNPLASISGSIELLGKSPDADEDSRALMSIITREIDRLNNLITEFLEYARPRPPSLVDLDLPGLIDDTLRVFAQDPRFEDVTVDFELPEDEVPQLRADPEKLRQLVWNLLRNAAEAASDGGKEVQIGIRLQESGLSLRVQDNGPGIPSELIDRVFDPFFTTKATGSGLGLATVHSIASEHGGSVNAQNLASGGAMFTVELPYNAGRED
jgi:two-component system sensor histidine kinase PilS (NtrC family)